MNVEVPKQDLLLRRSDLTGGSPLSGFAPRDLSRRALNLVGNPRAFMPPRSALANHPQARESANDKNENPNDDLLDHDVDL
jgi:hypothetical protein